VQVRIAYADPPYPGYSRYYRDDPRCAEIDHGRLIEQLCEYDGWALSTFSNALHEIIPLCPRHARVGAWVKPFCSFKPGVKPAYAWEPIIFVPARSGGRTGDTPRDWIAANITLKRGLVGAKPRRVALWLFSILGAEPADEFHDLFPGSGAVASAWAEFCRAPVAMGTPLFQAVC
jgi:hypothetical protein